MLQAESVALRGWGGGPGARAQLLEPADADGARAALAGLANGGRPATGAIPRGQGRSYGDAGQLSGGTVILTSGLTGFELDSEEGVVTAQAGVTIGALLRALVPRGWMVPVVPGTQHVTVGGAVASDIHGKNHGVAGTFGSHVQALGLLTAGGELLELEPGDEGFQATLGGMGLTGLILWVRLKLVPVTSALLAVDIDRVPTLDETLGILAAPEGGPHRVAWLDLLAPSGVRGVVTRAEHADAAALATGRSSRPASSASPTPTTRLTVPSRWPAGILRPATVRAFNQLRYRRTPRRARGHLEPLGTHMFPLDVLAAWPRLYGPRGFVQYQFVVPFGQEGVLERVIERLRAAQVPCYLAVLKDFGPANAAPLSFPIAGWTLAMDLPRAAAGLSELLEGFDELVGEAGGRVYLTKDARLRPGTVAAMYPRLAEWQAARERLDPEGLWRSDLGLRTGLVQ